MLIHLINRKCFTQADFFVKKIGQWSEIVGKEDLNVIYRVDYQINNWSVATPEGFFSNFRILKFGITTTSARTGSTYKNRYLPE